MSGWWSMDNEFECANCGKVGTRHTLEESVRRCGTGYGEWYCMEGEGCQTEKAPETNAVINHIKKVIRELEAMEDKAT